MEDCSLTGAAFALAVEFRARLSKHLGLLLRSITVNCHNMDVHVVKKSGLW